jgi:hypothetical protein
LAANFIPAPVQVSGGLPTGVLVKSKVQGSGGMTRTRAMPATLPSFATTAPPCIGPAAAVNTPFSSTLP